MSGTGGARSCRPCIRWHRRSRLVSVRANGRAVAGLTTAEIAHPFLVPESTMAQRIYRAKGAIRTSRIPFSCPSPGERDQGLSSVPHTLYLLFSEGYASSTGPAFQRTEIAHEAIRLARLLHSLLPEDPEVIGLVALMLLTHARRAARTGPRGELIPLTNQDRQKWDPLTSDLRVEVKLTY